MTLPASRRTTRSAPAGLDAVETSLAGCTLADRARLAARAASLRAEGGGSRRARERLERALAAALARREARARAVPAPRFPDELPVAQRREDIARAVSAHPVTIVTGETGSGKTTQLPKICLALGRGVDGAIAHTQPRRLAAHGVAARLADELDGDPHGVVGYRVRFQQRVGERCLVKVVTDGILLAEIQSDPDLLAYDTIVVDEAHERSLNIDFLLGYLRALLARRPELKIVVSSATIDAERFSAFFGGAPVVAVEGRRHPVEIRYCPPAEPDVPAAVDAALGELLAEAPGDVLVFLSGEREIHDTAKRLARARRAGVEVLPVYARLPLARQARLFAPHQGRRVVLATNVAETSLTVPGIRHVIDVGTARVSRYSHRAPVQRLPVEPVSRASADQRAGRCGRTGPGICVRLYAEDDYRARPAFAQPEIQRANLAAVLLRMRALGFSDAQRFPFLDPPDRRHVNDGMRLLQELGAIDAADRLTGVGRRLARLPVDPRLGRMLLAAADLGCVADVLVIASFLSVPDPRERPPGRARAADEAHRTFRDSRSDFVTVLNLWRRLHEAGRGGPAGVRRFCKRRWLGYARVREWQDVHRQLRELARELGLPLGAPGATYARVHRALLAGLLRHVGARGGEREYSGLRDQTFALAPGCALYPANARWLVAAELVETDRLYAFLAARVRPEWIEEAAGSLVRRDHHEAYWDVRRGEAMVLEKVSLYGLAIIARRRVRYSPLSRAGAREVFVRSALVDGLVDPEPAFLAGNRALVERLRAVEDKLRRPDLLVSEEAVFRFYDARLPRDVFDSRSFAAWLDAAGDARLRMTPEALGAGEAVPDAASFPDAIRVGAHRVRLEYRFAPGEPDDGITAEIPLDALAELDPGPFEWLVPGRAREKILALLRALPKAVRREIGPAAEVADAFAAETPPGEGSLREALARHLRARFGVSVESDAWDEPGPGRRVAPELEMRFRVVDGDGRTLGADRDLAALQRTLRAGRRAPGRAPKPQAPIERATAWTFGRLPESVAMERGGVAVRGHPALVDAGDGVELRAVESRVAADRATRAGVLRLLLIALNRDLKRVARELPDFETTCLVYALVPPPDAAPAGPRPPDAPAPGTCAELRDHVVRRAVERACLDGDAPPRDEAAFRAVLERGRRRVGPEAERVAELCRTILDRHRALVEARAAPHLRAPPAVLEDVDRQLRGLVFQGFVGAIDADRLEHLPRYLDALAVRLEKIARGGARDERKLERLRPFQERYDARRRAHAERGREDPELDRYRWLLEEYRVSLFAQALGTAETVSPERLETQWRRVAA